MVNLFNTYLYNPILAILVYIYNNLAFQDLGLAIILLTIFVRIILFPLLYKGARDQSLMQRLQPHIKKIQLDHKDNKEEQAKKLLKLYREHNVNPFSSILLLIFQLPILIAIYRVFLQGLSIEIFDNQIFLGLINLGENSIILVAIAAILQYFQAKLILSSPNIQSQDKSSPFASVGKSMVWIGPILTFVILVNLPAALALYWLVSNIFSIGQQIFINKRLPSLEQEHANTSSENKNNS